MNEDGIATETEQLEAPENTKPISRRGFLRRIARDTVIGGLTVLGYKYFDYENTTPENPVGYETPFAIVQPIFEEHTVQPSPNDIPQAEYGFVEFMVSVPDFPDPHEFLKARYANHDFLQFSKHLDKFFEAYIRQNGKLIHPDVNTAQLKEISIIEDYQDFVLLAKFAQSVVSNYIKRKKEYEKQNEEKGKDENEDGDEILENRLLSRRGLLKSAALFGLNTAAIWSSYRHLESLMETVIKGSETGKGGAGDILIRLFSNLSMAHPEDTILFFRNLIWAIKMNDIGEDHYRRYGEVPKINLNVGAGHKGVIDMMRLGNKTLLTLLEILPYPNSWLQKMMIINGDINKYITERGLDNIYTTGGLDNFCTTRVLTPPKNMTFNDLKNRNPDIQIQDERFNHPKLKAVLEKKIKAGAK